MALLKDDFLQQLTQHCFELERLVFALATGSDITTDYDSLFRLMHNLKGAGGTHGVPLVTSICHVFEDNLSTQRDSHKFDKAFVDHSLTLVDLLRRVASDSEENSAGIAAELDIIRQTLRRNLSTVMVLESSKLMLTLLENAFAQMPVQLTVIADGMQALNRLLHEPVDVIIASNNISSLSGLAVTSAIKANAALNANVPVLFYSSNSNLAVEKLHGMRAFHKTPELAKQLAFEVEKLTQNII